MNWYRKAGKKELMQSKSPWFLVIFVVSTSEEMNFFVQENGLSGISEEKWGFSGERVSTGRDFNEKFVDTMTSQETQENSQVTHSPTHTKENELTLKRLAKSLFELQQPDSEASITHSLVNILNFLPMFLTSLQKMFHFTVLSLSTFFFFPFNF